METQELAKVTNVYFGKEDHGILTLNITLDYGGACQGFGGYSLDEYDKQKEKRVGTAAGMDFVLRVLDCFGVSNLDQIVGKTVYAIRDSSGYSAKIIGLRQPPFDGKGEFLVSDWKAQWFERNTHVSAQEQDS